MNIGNKIINLRKQNNMSQEDLASKLNVSRQSISKWESNNATPDAYNILELSKLFNVTTDYLLYDDYQSDDDIPKIKEVKKEIAINQTKKKQNLLTSAILWLIASFSFYIATFLSIISAELLYLNSILCFVLAIINFYRYFKMTKYYKYKYNNLDIYLMIIFAILTLIITYSLNRFNYNEIALFTVLMMIVGILVSRVINHIIK